MTYAWDARNRLKEISGPNGTASFKYDALGRRIAKTVNGQTVSFVYDGVQAIAEITGSAITATYLTSLQIDEVLARYAGTGNKTLLTDALGSVIAQANEDQTIQNFYAYTPYGEAQPLGPDDNNPIQYTGRENDQTGLYYYRARYYDPVLKRFIAEDPIGIASGLNLWAYVRGNPISFADPTGLDTITLMGGGSAIVSGGVAGSGGIYISNKPFDIGVIVQGEVGAGFDIGLSGQFGYQTGTVSNLSAPTVNYNLSPGVVTVTVQTDPRTGNITGGSAGPSTRIIASRTYSRASTYGLRDFFDWLFPRIFGCP